MKVRAPAMLRNSYFEIETGMEGIIKEWNLRS